MSTAVTTTATTSSSDSSNNNGSSSISAVSSTGPKGEFRCGGCKTVSRPARKTSAGGVVSGISRYPCEVGGWTKRRCNLCHGHAKVHLLSPDSYCACDSQNLLVKISIPHGGYSHAAFRGSVWGLISPNAVLFCVNRKNENFLLGSSPVR
ncbi:hypothetical protein RRG08_053884 [Elysia crispata]|uniref:Uncharacterized protein n=1 Tax=Elysia crispata TaxID=231223 RepID=A0AAE1D1I7_9GAST|nr:hypothetical protein RRG08_053884 [Elysia crispata]